MESGFKIRGVVINPHHFSLEPRVGRRSENGEELSVAFYESFGII